MNIFNTLSGKIEPLQTMEPNKLRMYVCGPTVYNFIHIGNARPICVFDVFRRYLMWRGYDVTYVQNYTDVNDKIIRQAAQEGLTPEATAEKYIHEYETDAQGLNVLPPTVQPRVSTYMPQIIAFIQKLIDNGYAYQAEGDVYYRTRRFTGYGKLSGQSLDDLIAGARVEINSIKEDPLDFALWKGCGTDEQHWDSPWGPGRPGWHIECSAMAKDTLGETIDLHCGGHDLIVPHHENEIAQSEAANGVPFAHYWMHNGHINVDNKKMSKSAGNFFTVRDISKEFDPEVVRMFMLSAHYRSPINFSRELMEQARAGLERLYTARNNALFALDHAPRRDMNGDESAFVARSRDFMDRFDDAMCDDLNTSEAMGVLFEYVRDMNTALSDANAPCVDAIEAGLAALNTMAHEILGLLMKEADTVPDEIKALVQARADAKKARDFAEADRIRAQVLEMGYVIEDTPKGPKVKKA